MLIVPDNAEDKYRAHEIWGQFWIETPTRIKSPEEGRSMTEDGIIFNLSGQQNPVLQKGINIIRYSDGTSKKLMVK